ncbi:hypothetical protein ACQY0O_004383 [Thecaphora frezii]
MPLHYLRNVKKRGAASPPRHVQIGISPYKAVLFAFAAIVVLPAIIYLPWFMFMFSPTSGLPEFWVRSASLSPVASGEGAAEVEPRCWNARTGVDDPYARPAPFSGWDPKRQMTDYCEDVEVVEALGVAVLSCDPSRHGWNTVMGPLANPNPRGALWIYDYGSTPSTEDATTPSASGLEVVRLVDFPDRFDFHPLGISVHADAGSDGRARLFVANHQRHRSTIEVFDLRHRDATGEGQGAGWEAIYVRTLVHPLATHTPNSIHALGPTSLLVTQDHFFARRMPPLAQLTQTLSHLLPLPRWSMLGPLVAPAVAKIVSPRPVSALLSKIETFLGLPLSWVVHVAFDADVGRVGAPTSLEQQQQEQDAATAAHSVMAHVVVRDIPFANGVALSPNRSTLAVASSMYPGVWLYDVGTRPTVAKSHWATKPQQRKRQAAPTTERTVDWTNPTHVRLREKVHLPFIVDNIGFAPDAPAYTSVAAPSGGAASATASPPADPFDGAQLIASGHPDALKLIRFAKTPYGGSAPSWVVAVRPSHAYLSGKDKLDLEALQRNLEYDRDAPLQANRRVLSHNTHWQLVSLYQASESGARSAPGLPASSGAALIEDKLVVAGLYAHGLLVCSGVGR